MSPLRRIRKKSGQRLSEVAKAISYDAANLSRVERLKQVPGPGVAAKLVEHFGRQITELEIIYPERYMPAGEGTSHKDGHAR